MTFKKHYLKIIGITLLLTTSNTTYSSEYDYKVITGHLPPWSEKAGQGIFIEIVAEIEKRLNNHHSPTFFPWSRALKETEASTNIIIFPLPRISSREEHFRWIVEVAKLDMGFISIKEPINDFKQAQKLSSIIVSQKTAMSDHLEALNFHNVLPVTVNLSSIIKMLINNRVDAWFTDIQKVKYQFQNSGVIDKLYFGRTLWQGRMYIAASKGISEELVRAYRLTYLEMYEDGTVNKITQKYLALRH